jgi:hypothetical protein
VGETAVQAWRVHLSVARLEGQHRSPTGRRVATRAGACLVSRARSEARHRHRRTSASTASARTYAALPSAVWLAANIAIGVSSDAATRERVCSPAEGVDNGGGITYVYRRLPNLAARNAGAIGPTLEHWSCARVRSMPLSVVFNGRIRPPAAWGSVDPAFRGTRARSRKRGTTGAGYSSSDACHRQSATQRTVAAAAARCCPRQRPRMRESVPLPERVANSASPTTC